METFLLRTQNMFDNNAVFLAFVCVCVLEGGGGYIILSASLSFDFSILRNKICSP